MPRERIQHGDMYLIPDDVSQFVADSTQPLGESGRIWRPGDDVPKGFHLREMQSLDVNWNREAGWVQVCVEAPIDWWKSFILGMGEAEASHYGAYSQVLDRRQINRLIATLRRARDAAYGKDE